MKIRAPLLHDLVLCLYGRYCCCCWWWFVALLVCSISFYLKVDMDSYLYLSQGLTRRWAPRLSEVITYAANLFTIPENRWLKVPTSCSFFNFFLFILVLGTFVTERWCCVAKNRYLWIKAPQSTYSCNRVQHTRNLTVACRCPHHRVRFTHWQMFTVIIMRMMSACSRHNHTSSPRW